MDSPKSDGFKGEVYLNPCLRVTIIPLRLRFVTSKISQFKITQLNLNFRMPSKFRVSGAAYQRSATYRYVARVVMM